LLQATELGVSTESLVVERRRGGGAGRERERESERDRSVVCTFLFFLLNLLSLFLMSPVTTSLLLTEEISLSHAQG
jgi:hypothetical protein